MWIEHKYDAHDQHCKQEYALTSIRGAPSLSPMLSSDPLAEPSSSASSALASSRRFSRALSSFCAWNEKTMRMNKVGDHRLGHNQGGNSATIINNVYLDKGCGLQSPEENCAKYLGNGALRVGQHVRGTRLASANRTPPDMNMMGRYINQSTSYKSVSLQSARRLGHALN